MNINNSWVEKYRPKKLDDITSQKDVVISLRKSSPQSADEMLNTKLKISNAQKYRYLKKLISLKFISKKHNQYIINKS